MNMFKQSILQLILLGSFLLGCTFYAQATKDSLLLNKQLDEPQWGIDYNFGYEENTVPEDWTNDLWLNKDYEKMLIGQTDTIVARRVPEINPSMMGSNVVLPPFTYTIVSGNSVSVNPQGVITANSLGLTVIEVSYGDTTLEGTTYGACSPVNRTYMVLEVLSDTSSSMNITHNIADSYDTFYFTGESKTYEFTANCEGGNIASVSCNGLSLNLIEGTTDTYSASLKNRANIIEIKSVNGSDTLRFYKVVDARKIDLEIENLSSESSSISTSDSIKISFKGIVPPVYKLATIYNPTYESSWGGVYTKVIYTNAHLGTVSSNSPDLSQYGIAQHNAIHLRVPDEAGTYLFNSGHIHEEWWGADLGTEKTMSGPGTPPTNAEVQTGDFSVFPDLSLVVESNTGVNWEEEETQLIYPNPAKNRMYINLSEQLFNIEVIDMNGRVILKQNRINSKEVIDISSLEKSVYWVRIQSDSNIYIEKLIKL